MKRKVVLWILILLLLALPLFPSAFAEGLSTEQSELSERLEQFIQTNQASVTGINLALIDHDSSIAEHYIGWADREAKIAMDQQTVSDWGSVSKLLIWISLAQLEEQGLLNYDDDITIYLPDDFLKNLRYDQPITFLNLMNHNAGFEDSLVNLFVRWDSEVPSLGDVLKSKQPTQVFQPGVVTAYSNWSSGLAAYLVELISGTNYADYVHRHIFTPLGMKDTAIRPDLSDNPSVRERRMSLQSYTMDGRRMDDALMSIPLYPAGMVVGTLQDFQRFAQELLSPAASKLFQKSDSLERLFQPTSRYESLGAPRNSHGFWHYGVAGEVIGHGGNTAGGTASLLIDKQRDLALVTMSNVSQESVFSNELPEVIFGPFSDSEYFIKDRPIPSFLLQNARSTFTGPLSFTRASLVYMEESDSQTLWDYTEHGGVKRIQTPYTDLLRLDTPQAILLITLIVSFVIGAVYGLFTLIGGGLILRPIQKRRLAKLHMSPLPQTNRSWNYISAAILVLFFLNIIVLLLQLIMYQPQTQWFWQILLATGLMVGMLVLMVSYLEIHQALNRPVVRIKYLVTFILLGLMFMAGMYFHIYQFWKI